MRTRPAGVLRLPCLAALCLAAWGGFPGPSRPAWRTVARGVEVAEVRMEPDAPGLHFRALLLRFDPGALRLSLVDSARAGGLKGAWSIDAVPPGVTVAMNAGQFRGGQPWGWLVQGGREVRPPGRGPLATAVAVTRDGAVLLEPWTRMEALRRRDDVAWAFQSYPTLLADGQVPHALEAPGRGVDLEHRDTRLALGVDGAGRVVVALSRFPGVAVVPLGPTVPEMVVLMASLGCSDAVLLDGGLSGQLLVRGDEGEAVRAWSGLRRVPLGLVGRPR